MAIRTLDHSKAVPFETEYDTSYMVRGHEPHETALQINPHASHDVLLASAQRRVHTLKLFLDPWAGIGDSDYAHAQALAESSMPLIEEVETLLVALGNRLHRDSATSSTGAAA